MPSAVAGVLACFLILGAASHASAQNAGSGQAGSTPSSTPSAGVAVPQNQTRQGDSSSRTKGAHRHPSRNTHTRPGKGAPTANGEVEIIGAKDGIKTGTLSQPLLPIASLGNQAGIPSGAPIQVRFTKAVDSGHTHNGDVLDATLAQAVANFPAGTAVKLTVVQASPAGALLSFGELSLQVISIGGKAVLSETISAQGKEGKKEQADSAPALGTEAGFSAGQIITLPAS